MNEMGREINMMVKRLAIYATYDQDGIVDDYIVYCIGELQKADVDVLVVSNHTLSSEQKERLVGITQEIYEREDSGYDMGGFAYALELLKSQARLNNYDEIIFVNDSVFGPFYPLDEMLSEMDKRKDIDFWGITKRGESDFDGGDAVYPEHIQLYFYAVRREMLNSRDFSDYWNEIPNKVTDFRSAILNYEFAFTKYFADRGFKWDVYCDTDRYITNNPKNNLSPYHYCSYSLIKNGCPWLKRKLFTGDFIDGRYCDRSDLRKALDYIAQHTNYDVKLIWLHILRTYPLGNIMESLQLIEFITAGLEPSQEDKAYAKIIYGSDNRLKSDKQGKYMLYMSPEADSRRIEPLFHAEKRCVMDNLMLSDEYVAKVVELFERKPMLGVLVPPMKTFGKISKSTERKWKNEKIASEIYEKYRLSVPFGKTAPIHEINAFWCRSDILDEEILHELKNDNTGTMMQMIPIIAQQKGYYTEILMNTDYAAGLLTNMQKMMRDMWEMTLCSSDRDMDLKEMQDMVYAQKILEFSKGTKKLYIYGAGQLACRVLNMIADIKKPTAIVVSDKNGNAKSILGYPVMEIDEIDVTDASFIIAVGKKNNHFVENKIKTLGITDYLLLT